MVRRDDWVKGAHFRLRLVRTPGVAAGQDWSKGSAELSIRARALSLKYRSECTGVRLFCLVIIYNIMRRALKHVISVKRLLNVSPNV